METKENDFDRIAKQLDEAVAMFTGNVHEYFDPASDSLTMTRDGFIKSVVRFQRLRDWVEGLAESSRKHNLGHPADHLRANVYVEMFNHISELKQRIHDLEELNDEKS